MIEKKRLTAIKSKIAGITSGKYMAKDDNNYILTKSAQRIGRVRLLSTVVDKFVSESKKMSSITLDDGTDTIRAKTFDSMIFEKINVGEIVDIVGKIREYNGEIYVLTENIWNMPNPNFEMLRELEIGEQNRLMESKKKLVLEYKKQISDLQELKRIMKEFGVGPEDVEAVIDSESLIEPEKDVDIGTDEQKGKILSAIEQLDKGEGCNYSELMEASGLPENVLDVVVEELLNEGSCFEPKPGRIRKL